MLHVATPLDAANYVLPIGGNCLAVHWINRLRGEAESRSGALVSLLECYKWRRGSVLTISMHHES